MKEAVTKVIDTLTQEDFYEAFQKLLERYNKSIADQKNVIKNTKTRLFDLKFFLILNLTEDVFDWEQLTKWCNDIQTFGQLSRWIKGNSRNFLSSS